MVRNSRDIGNAIDQAIAEASAGLPDDDMLEIGHLGISIITLRTKTGRDVDLAPFERYSPDYAKARKRRSLSTTPDLAVTGHMLGAMQPATRGDEVVISFLSAADERKADIHNKGRKYATVVKSHSRSVYVDKGGRRVSREEAARDRRRKNKKLTQRAESVGKHIRAGVVPKREFFDIRHPSELKVIEEVIASKYSESVDKALR